MNPVVINTYSGAGWYSDGELWKGLGDKVKSIDPELDLRAEFLGVPEHEQTCIKKFNAQNSWLRPQVETTVTKAIANGAAERMRTERV